MEPTEVPPGSKSPPNGLPPRNGLSMTRWSSRPRRHSGLGFRTSDFPPPGGPCRLPLNSQPSTLNQFPPRLTRTCQPWTRLSPRRLSSRPRTPPPPLNYPQLLFHAQRVSMRAVNPAGGSLSGFPEVDDDQGFVVLFNRKNRAPGVKSKAAMFSPLRTLTLPVKFCQLQLASRERVHWSSEFV